jgi:hypothetical protein
MKVRDVLDSYGETVAIVHYVIDADYNGGTSPQNPACLLQISLKPSKISPSGKLIRLGDTPGDEIVGWTKLESLEVVEILGKLEGTTVIPLERAA